jgi:hypothetical protein
MLSRGKHTKIYEIFRIWCYKRKSIGSLSIGGMRLVPWLYTNNAVQEISDNVILYDLSKIRGINAILSRVPQDFSGIYVWYRRFSFDQSAFDDPEAFVAAVLSELCKEHCAEREGQLPPMYRVSLKPETYFYKEDSLRKFASNKTFRQLVLTLLENSLLFQQPMYIGKATNLYNRIRSHLREGSKLRERFNLAGHNIDQCRLLLVGMPPELSSQYNEQNSDFESELPEAESEQLVEDILSRLFLPSFTLRYG